MSNLLKSKFFLGAVIVAVMFVGVVATNATPAAADCSITSTLRVGSTGTQVVCLQTALGGLTADGNFGPMTKAAVVRFQQNSGLVADGIFGPKSNAVWMANAGNSANFPVGCTSAVGYSLSTGLPCTALPANTFAPAGCTSASGFSSVTGGACYAVSAGLSGFTPAGCTSAAGFSPVTGGACQASNLPAGCTSTAGFSPTTGGSCSGTPASVVSSTGEGSLTVSYDAIPINSTTVNRGENKAVMGIKVKATGSNMTVTRLWLDFATRIWLSADSVTLLDGTTVLATLPLSASTVSEVVAGSSYQIQFNGLNFVVPVNTTKVLTVKVGRPTATVADTDVVIADTSSLRAVDAAGISDTYVLSTGTRTWNLAAAAASAGTLTATLSTTSPAMQSVSGISATAGVLTPIKLMDFDLKATTGPINVSAIAGTTANDAVTCAVEGASCFASIELRDSNGTVLDSVAGAATFSFTELSIDIAADTTKTLSIWVQMNPISATVTAGSAIHAVVTTVTATTGTSFTNVSLAAQTVTGKAQYLFRYAPTFTLGTHTCASSAFGTAGVTVVDCTLAFIVTAPAGSDIYVDGAALATAAGSAPVAKTTAGYGGTLAALRPTVSGVAATGGTSGYDLVSAGASRTFTISGHIPSGAGTAGAVGITLATNGIKWTTADSATTPTPITQTWGLADFLTNTAYITPS